MQFASRLARVSEFISVMSVRLARLVAAALDRSGALSVESLPAVGQRAESFQAAALVAPAALAGRVEPVGPEATVGQVVRDERVRPVELVEDRHLDLESDW